MSLQPGINPLDEKMMPTGADTERTTGVFLTWEVLTQVH